MGIVINKGTEFWRNGRLYQVTKKLGPNRFEARHHKNELDVITLNSLDVSHGVDRGDIEFVTRGLSGKVIPFYDLAGMPEKDLNEVLRRKKYIEKALDHTRYEQTMACMENAIKEAAEELSEIVVDKDEKTRKRKKAHKNQRKAPSARTVYRWVKTFVKSGKNIRSLVSNRKQHKSQEFPPPAGGENH